MLAQENKRLRLKNKRLGDQLDDCQDELEELKEYVKQLATVNLELKAKLLLKDIDLEEKEQCLTRAMRMIKVDIDLTQEPEKKSRRTQVDMLKDQESRFVWYK